LKARGYNKRVEVWITSAVEDGFGGYTTISELLTKSWAKLETVDLFSQNILNTNYGLNDSANSLKVTVRKRNDLIYDLQRIYLVYRGEKYVIKSYATNTNFEDNTITFIVTKEPNKKVEQPLEEQGFFDYTFDFNL
jgi:hypothetical protein